MGERDSVCLGPVPRKKGESQTSPNEELACRERNFDSVRGESREGSSPEKRHGGNSSNVEQGKHQQDIKKKEKNLEYAQKTRLLEEGRRLKEEPSGLRNGVRTGTPSEKKSRSF